jgi:hypothetical protein
MSHSVPSAQTYKFYTSEIPLLPEPVKSGNSAPILGAILGMFCGWLIVNLRWLAGSSSRPVSATAPVTDDKTDYIDEPTIRPDSSDGSYQNDRPDQNDRPERNARKKKTDLDPQEAAILAEMKNWETHGAVETDAKAKPDEDDWMKEDMSITPEGKDIKDDMSR